MRFAKALPSDSSYQPRDVLAGKDARQLARELLAMSQEEFSRAFSKSPMKRAKLRGLKRNAAVVLGNVGSPEDVNVLTLALEDEEPRVREHAAWALARLAERDGAHESRQTHATHQHPKAGVRSPERGVCVMPASKRDLDHTCPDMCP